MKKLLLVFGLTLASSAHALCIGDCQAQSQGQQQGQAQGQAQGQIAVGGTSSASSSSGGNTLSNAGNNSTATQTVGMHTQTTGAVTQSNAGNNSSNSSQGNTTTVLGGTYKAADIPSNTAYAPSLSSANGTCMGSTSAGLQVATFGFTGGGTWTDSDCDRRYDAQELRAQGNVRAATALMCQKASVRKAMEEAGTPCPGPVSVGGDATTVVSDPVLGYADKTDPYIRRRLGLAPL